MAYSVACGIRRASVLANLTWDRIRQVRLADLGDDRRGLGVNLGAIQVTNLTKMCDFID